MVFFDKFVGGTGFTSLVGEVTLSLKPSKNLNFKRSHASGRWLGSRANIAVNNYIASAERVVVEKGTEAFLAFS